MLGEIKLKVILSLTLNSFSMIIALSSFRKQIALIKLHTHIYIYIYIYTDYILLLFLKNV